MVCRSTEHFLLERIRKKFVKRWEKCIEFKGGYVEKKLYRINITKYADRVFLLFLFIEF